MPGRIRIGIGGWTYEPWRGVFYPKGLPHKDELTFASRALSSIEINGTFYSRFKPETWRKWRDETPDDFVFSVKASRYCTNRRVLAEAGPAVKRFLEQGLVELGPKLGPINWQFAATKRFEKADFEAFLALLPDEMSGVPLFHALEVRHESFADPEFVALARRHRAAIVSSNREGSPGIDEATAAFTYARMMSTEETLAHGITDAALKSIASRVKRCAETGDVFVYFIAAAKIRNPAAAAALIAEIARPEVTADPRRRSRRA